MGKEWSLQEQSVQCSKQYLVNIKTIDDKVVRIKIISDTKIVDIKIVSEIICKCEEKFILFR